MSQSRTPWGVGVRTVRPDAESKVAGEARYLADIPVGHMLHAAICGSPIASGEVKGIDTAKAKEHPGVEAVITAKDLGDNNRIGGIFDDQPVLADTRVRMVGDRLAVVAARTRKAAHAAASKIELELEETRGLFDVEKALSQNAPKVHPSGNLIKEFTSKRGDLAQARKKASVKVSHTYRIGGQEHAYLEGQACLVVPGPGPTLDVYISTQCPAYVRARVSRVTGIQHAGIRVIQTVTGGGFGGKEDYPDEPACCAALLALKTGRPVRLLLPREEDFQVSTKRHRMVIRNTLHAREDGRITAAEVEILVDAGGYAGMSTIVAERSNVSCLGPYVLDAIDVKTKVLYTNNLFGGPFRGFGAPQVTAAMEAQMNLLAEKVGVDPVEIRRRNLVSEKRPTFATGQTLENPDMGLKTLELAASQVGWKNTYSPRGEGERASGAIRAAEARDRFREGLGVATAIYGANLHHGGQALDRGGAQVMLQPDGSVSVSIGNTEMGQGALAACRAITSQALGVDPARIRVTEVDTGNVPDSGPTVASRGTQVAGRAIIDACEPLRERLKSVASNLLDNIPAVQLKMADHRLTDPVSEKFVTFEEVVTELYRLRIQPVSIGWFRSEDRDYDPETGCGSPYAYYCFATHIAKVRVDTWTGAVKVLEVTAAHDVGKAIHPTSLEGQIQGGVTQGVGWATMEEFVLHKGKLLNRGFTDYLIPTSTDAPEVRIHLIEEEEPRGPYGAKGIGEPSFIPCGAAVLGAVSNALGAHLTELPATAERVRSVLMGDRDKAGYLSHLESNTE